MSENKYMTIAIDIGNTRTQVAAVDTRELTSHGREDICNTELCARLGKTIRSLADAYPDIGGINISSCVKNLGETALDICEAEKLPFRTRIVSAQSEIRIDRYGAAQRSIKINYGTAQTLGSDRLCDAVACAAKFKGEDCVIIDAGTAVTIDLLRGGVFEGGAILPGISMQLRALHSGTDSLPQVLADGGDARSLGVRPLGTSTADCIRAGVLYGTAGAVERMVSEYRAISKDARAVITGGDREVLAKHIAGGVTIVPDLTLIGIGLY